MAHLTVRSMSAWRLPCAELDDGQARESLRLAVACIDARKRRRRRGVMYRAASAADGRRNHESPKENQSHRAWPLMFTPANAALNQASTSDSREIRRART